MDIFFVLLSFQKDAKRPNWRNEWTLIIYSCYNNVQVSRVIETIDNPTIKFPPRLSWQNPAANRIARSDRRLPNTLAIVFARRSPVVYVGVIISFQNKILTDMIRCVFEMKFTVFCVWWLIDFMLPRVLSVLPLANNPQMYWRYDNMIIQLRDSEKKLIQNKLFQAL